LAFNSDVVFRSGLMPSENFPLINGYFKINVQLFTSHYSVSFLEMSRKSFDANPHSYQMNTGGYS